MSHKEAARGFVCLIITQPELKCGGAISDEADSAPKGDCFVTPALPLRYASGTIVAGGARENARNDIHIAITYSMNIPCTGVKASQQR